VARPSALVPRRRARLQLKAAECALLARTRFSSRPIKTSGRRSLRAPAADLLATSTLHTLSATKKPALSPPESPPPIVIDWPAKWPPPQSLETAAGPLACSPAHRPLVSRHAPADHFRRSHATAALWRRQTEGCKLWASNCCKLGAILQQRRERFPQEVALSYPSLSRENGLSQMGAQKWRLASSSRAARQSSQMAPDANLHRRRGAKKGTSLASLPLGSEPAWPRANKLLCRQVISKFPADCGQIWPKAGG